MLTSLLDNDFYKITMQNAVSMAFYKDHAAGVAAALPPTASVCVGTRPALASWSWPGRARRFDAQEAS